MIMERNAVFARVNCSARAGYYDKISQGKMDDPVFWSEAQALATLEFSGHVASRALRRPSLRNVQVPQC